MYALGFLIGVIFLFFDGCIYVGCEEAPLILTTAIIGGIVMFAGYKIQDLYEDKKKRKEKEKEAEEKAKKEAQNVKTDDRIAKTAPKDCEDFIFPEIKSPEMRCTRCGKVIPEGEEHYTDMEHTLVCKDCYDRDVGSMVFARMHRK